MSSSESVEEIVERICTGELDKRKGYTQLFKQLKGLVRNTIRKTAKTATDNEIAGIASDVWADAWEKLETFDPEKGSFKTWICSIAYYKAIDFIRKQTNEPQTISLDRPMHANPGSEGRPMYETLEGPQLDNPLEAIVETERKTELSQQVIDALAELSKLNRTIVVLRTVYELKFKEVAKFIAEEHGILLTVKAVQNRYYRAQAKLRTKLGE